VRFEEQLLQSAQLDHRGEVHGVFTGVLIVILESDRDAWVGGAAQVPGGHPEPALHTGRRVPDLEDGGLRRLSGPSGFDGAAVASIGWVWVGHDGLRHCPGPTRRGGARQWNGLLVGAVAGSLSRGVE
jgi:hypothetical protein